MKVISSLNVKLPTIEFGVTLCKHNAGIGAVERIIGSIKNTFSKFVHQLKMHDEKLLTWIHLVIDKINNRPLILAAPLGITLTPNHILLWFRDSPGDEINLEVSVQHQLSRWKIVLSLFNSLWMQKYTRHRLMVTWKKQGLVPQVGDTILFCNKPIHCHCHQSPCPAQEEERRCLRSNSRVQERGGRSHHLRHQTSVSSLPVPGSGESWTSGADPRSSRGWSSWNPSSRCRSSAWGSSGRVHRLRFCSHKQILPKESSAFIHLTLF